MRYNRIVNPIASFWAPLTAGLKVIAVAVSLILALAHVSAAQAGGIVATGFDITGDNKTTAFAAILTGDVGYTASVLPDPYRVIIDMAHVGFDLPPGAGRKPKGLVKSIRYGVIEEGKSRIVIDTNGPVLITKSTLLPAKGKKPARISIQLMSIPKDVFAAAYAIDNAQPEVPPSLAEAESEENETVAAAEPATAVEPASKKKPQAVQETAAEPGDVVGSVTLAPVLKPTLKPLPGELKQKQAYVKPRRADGKKVIVIDPGHGGVDPGALSPSKTLEKDVVLAFGKTLKDILDADGRHHAVLTRDSDKFVSLKDRVAFARREGADLFIAIHADVLRGKTVTGTTIYTLSENASDAEAEELAQRENRADTIAGIDLGEQSEDVAGILIDLAQRDSRNQASMFSRATLRRFKDVTKMTGKPIRSAGFTVLKAPDVPSILIELGFLSNAKDEERLKTEAWRKSLAKALAAAIDSHFPSDVAVSR